MNVMTPDDRSTTKARHVLLVEDSSVTQDIVELMLTQAGHTVAIAADGATALQLLGERTFDVVLTDFHLPDITGLEVVRRHLAAHPNRKPPTFIAITGDVRGLLADRANCEVFDRVVPKPLDIDLVCELVEAPALPVIDLPITKPKNGHAIDELPFVFYHWPNGKEQSILSGLQGIDAIVVHSDDDLDRLWRQSGANLFPIIDLTGRMEGASDVDGTTLKLGDTAKIADLIDRFHERRAELHRDLVHSEDPADRLLARLYVSGGALTPRRSGKNRGFIGWNLIANPDDIATLVNRLAAQELISTTFFQRIHKCPSCGSARLLVCEECHECKSTHLEEESYLHHFRCAYQGPESDFRRQDELTCPKCRRELRHFGRDYDRPGLMVRCHSCEAITSEPNVAFVCVDCNDRSTTDTVPTHDVLSAEISEQGAAYLNAGKSFFGSTQQSLRFADLPLELVIKLNKAAARYMDAKTPFVLGYVGYDRISDVRSEQGARQAVDARRLWLETFEHEMPDKIIVARSSVYDFFLMLDIEKEALEPQLKIANERSNSKVRFDLGTRFHLFGPQDIS